MLMVIECVAVSYTHLDVYKRQEINNTATESILLNGISANSTPRAIENKISLEDLFILIKTQNSVLREQIDEKFEQQNIKFDEKFEQQNIKFDGKFEQQNLKFDDKFNQMNSKFMSLIHI